MQSLSETLQAATPRVMFFSARKTILSPAFERGFFTDMLPSGLICVFMNRLTGVMEGAVFFERAVYIVKTIGVPRAVAVKKVVHFVPATRVQQVVPANVVIKHFEQRIIQVRINIIADL